ncbi:hypothetical protein RB12114 [Rhodopirellula baltica SH 1]|uniref:Uncharacterized protein n=1 Tax=Rhodopirellula baltica (strain DSM 10527 / NCIMB 13988 / SH1) TaxID=243090 RepID=Q7UJ57_RHOBA|nr:hypothetical protein RB12114 [Rhodopirellula baltica SH 1]
MPPIWGCKVDPTKSSRRIDFDPIPGPLRRGQTVLSFPKFSRQASSNLSPHSRWALDQIVSHSSPSALFWDRFRAASRRHQEDSAHWQWPDCYRPSLRIRLLRNPSLQSVA